MPACARRSRTAKAEVRRQPARRIVLDLRNNPGGLLDQAVAVSDDFLDQGEIVSTRARHPEDSQRWNAKPGDIAAGPAAGGADQRRLGLAPARSSPARCRTIAGPCCSAPELRQGLRADRHAAARQWRDAADHGALLHAVRPLHPGPRDRAGHRGAREPRRARRISAPEREADLHRALRNQGGAPQPAGAAPRTDLPPIAKEIPKLPPEGSPTFDPTKPETDFQLQQALVVQGHGAARSAPRPTDAARDGSPMQRLRAAPAPLLLGWFWAACSCSPCCGGVVLQALGPPARTRRLGARQADARAAARDIPRPRETPRCPWLPRRPGADAPRPARSPPPDPALLEPAAAFPAGMLPRIAAGRPRRRCRSTPHFDRATSGPGSAWCRGARH